MPTFLQPVLVPDRCYLFEALLWVAFQRLPVFSSDHEGEDIRKSDENRVSGAAGYPVEVIDRYIFDEECERAGIPPDPSWRAALEGSFTLPVTRYDEMLRSRGLPKDYRETLKRERSEAIQFEVAWEAWRKHYQRAIEYPASKIFVALRDGRLATLGRLLPAVAVNEAVQQLAADGMDIYGHRTDTHPEIVLVASGNRFRDQCGPERKCQLLPHRPIDIRPSRRFSRRADGRGWGRKNRRLFHNK
jgi:hypothetical protein